MPLLDLTAAMGPQLASKRPQSGLGPIGIRRSKAGRGGKGADPLVTDISKAVLEILASEDAKELDASAKTFCRPPLVRCFHQLRRGVIQMAERNSYHVVPGEDGWKAEREGSSRASSVHDTQAAPIDAARGYLSRSGGGELNVHGDNKIRAKDTIYPGNDPRNTPG